MFLLKRLGLVCTHFYKIVFMFVKQNSWIPPKKILFDTSVSILFLKIICFFFCVGPMPFLKTGSFHYLFFFILFFYLILVFKHKINIIIFFKYNNKRIIHNCIEFKYS